MKATVRIDTTKPRLHVRAGCKIPCGFCGEVFRSYRCRYQHAKDCKYPEGKKKLMALIEYA